MLLDLNLAKKWLRLEEEDTEEDDILGLLIDNAEIYVKKRWVSIIMPLKKTESSHKKLLWF